MKLKLPWILLVISLAFNAFFLIGFTQARKQIERAKTFRGRTEAIAKQLNLDPQQYENFTRIRDEFEQLLRQLTEKRQEFFAELVKDHPDQKVVDAFRSGDSVKQLRLQVLDRIESFFGILRPEQRQKLVELVRKQAGPKHPS